MTPPPDVTDPDAVRKLVFASTICPVAVKGNGPKPEVGCRACPPFDRADARPDGTLARDPEEFWPLELLLVGSFTKPGAEEAVAVFTGCESHAENWGGSLLARRDGAGWRAIAYRSGVHPQSCKVVARPDARHLLVCRWIDGHQSYWHDRLFVYDFAQPDGADAAWTTLLDLDDSSLAACLGGIPPGGEVTRGVIDRFEASDADRDGDADIVVSVSHVRAKPGPAFQRWCARVERAAEKGGPAPAPGNALGQVTRHRLSFLWDGAAFRPDVATAATLATLAAAPP